MGTADRVVFGALGALGLFVGALALRPAAPRRPPRPAPGAEGDAAPRRAMADVTLPAAPALSGSYLPEIVAAQDSVLRRWPDRAEPLRVWVQPESAVEGWSARLVQPARDAVLTWDQAGLPLRLVLTPDSATAEVRVTWVGALERPRIGVARVESDGGGWITGGTLLLAVHRADGSPLPESTVRAAALHETGHLLGLNHTADTTAIMAPTATARDRLAPADLATARLLYALPAGRVRE